MFNKPVPIVRKVWDPEKENRTKPAVPQSYFKAALLVATFRAFRYIRRNAIGGRQRFNIDDEKYYLPYFQTHTQNIRRFLDNRVFLETERLSLCELHKIPSQVHLNTAGYLP